MKHSKLSERIEEVISKPEKVRVKLKEELVDIAYPPIVQSGGAYDFKCPHPPPPTPTLFVYQAASQASYFIQPPAFTET